MSKTERALHGFAHARSTPLAEESVIKSNRPVNRRWLPLNALRAFDAVGNNLSFTAGAQALNVSQSAVSRHVISLEELLRNKLFDRTGSGLALTPSGAALLPEVTKAFNRIEQVMNDICDNAAASRPIRLHVPPSLLQQIVLPMIQEFHTEHPEIQIDISSSHGTGLPAAETDMAIVFDRPHVDDRVTDLLWMVRVAPVCSPRTAAKHARKGLEAFLADNQLLHVKLADEPRGLLWRTFARQSQITLDADRDLSFDTALLAVSYAMTADGVALADIAMFTAELADGRLVMPFDAAVEDGFGYYLKLAAEDLADPAIGLFRSFLINRFAARAERSR